MKCHNIFSDYKKTISANVYTDARPGSKAFSDAVSEFEKANGYHANTFIYRATYGARGAVYPVSFRRF